MRKRRRFGRIEIDVTDLLDQVEDDDLLEEIKSRGIDAGIEHDGMDMAREAYNELLRGRSHEAMSILDRLLNPKWKSRDACSSALDTFWKQEKPRQSAK